VKPISVTAHGRVVVELGPTATAACGGQGTRFEALVAAGLVTPAADTGDPTASWPDIRLAPGSARQLMDEDRGDAWDGRARPLAIGHPSE